MELIETDFLEGDENTETKWLAKKPSLGMKTVLSWNPFLVCLGSSTVLLGLKGPQRWSVHLTDLTGEENKEVKGLSRVRLPTNASELGLDSRIGQGASFTTLSKSLRSLFKMNIHQTYEWELRVWEQGLGTCILTSLCMMLMHTNVCKPLIWVLHPLNKVRCLVVFETRCK